MQNDGNNSFSATQVDEFNFLLTHAESLDPREPRVWRARGVLNDELGDSEKALEAARHAAELDPNDWRTQQLLGRLLGKKGENPAALEAVNRALTHMESSGYNQRKRKELISLHRDLLRKLGRNEEAASANLELHSIEHRDPSAATPRQFDLSAYFNLSLDGDPPSLQSDIEQTFGASWR